MHVLYVQPFLAAYRLPLVSRLAKDGRVTVVADNQPESGHKHDLHLPDGAEFVPSKTASIGPIKFQLGLLSTLLRVRPAAVLIFADLRYASLWGLLLLARIRNIPVYLHGQGLFRREARAIDRAIFRLAISLSTKYICYTHISKDSLLKIGVDPNNLGVIENTLILSSAVRPTEKTYAERGILFLGRLRRGCNLELLIDAVLALPDCGYVVHVIGAGEYERELKAKYSGYQALRWHGAIHDDEEIARISRECRIACYPGDAGLSVVHYFALSLPVVLHGSISSHMGPEPSYVRDGENGFVFERANLYDLKRCLRAVAAITPEELRKHGEAGYRRYMDLSNPPMHEQFVQFLRGPRKVEIA